MIEHIRTEGFKGFDLNEPVPEKAIYIGKNKSGKSTRAGAIAIAIYGHIPFYTAGKRPGDILDSFGGDSLIAAVTIGGKEFARKFSRNAKGGVTQSVQVDKKRASAENFAILLDRAGAPRISDVAEFMKQSEAKKIDTLFDLFPNTELDSIDNDIEIAKESVSRLEKKKAGAESTVVRLTSSKQDFEIPSGSIAEIQAEIKSVDSKIVELEEQIKQAEIEEARIEAEKKAEVKIEEAMAEGERKGKERAEKEAAEKPNDPLDEKITEMEKQISDFKSRNGTNPNPHQVNPPLSSLPDYESIQELSVVLYDPRDSIQRIIDALNGAGCGTCAALIVAKQELKKFNEEVSS